MDIDLNSAAKIVKEGGIIIFPTDTAFGIGCRIDNEASLRRLFKIRKRSRDKAVPVLFESIKQVKEYFLPFDLEVENLMKEYWPGGLTLILRCIRVKVPSLVRGGGETLGVRIPDHDLILRLIKRVGVPIVGTSANFAGEKTPFRFEDLNKDLVSKVDGVLIGQTKSTRTSTVIDCTQKPWRILRQGAVNLKI